MPVSLRIVPVNDLVHAPELVRIHHLDDHGLNVVLVFDVSAQIEGIRVQWKDPHRS